MSSERLGFLRTCIDKRFVEASRREFEKATGLGPTDYWHEAYAGGSARDPSLVVNNAETGDNLYADQYAASKGAMFFGWQAHIDNCGGLPDATNAQIESALIEHIKAKVEEYPDRTHYYILASEEGIKIKPVPPF